MLQTIGILSSEFNNHMTVSGNTDVLPFCFNRIFQKPGRIFRTRRFGSNLFVINTERLWTSPDILRHFCFCRNSFAMFSDIVICSLEGRVVGQENKRATAVWFGDGLWWSKYASGGPDVLRRSKKPRALCFHKVLSLKLTEVRFYFCMCV